MDVRNQFLEKQTEKDLAEAFAIVSNQFLWVEDDTYDDEKGTPEYARACAIANEWGALMDEYEAKIFKILASEGIAIPERGKIQVLEPFMARNGYVNGKGWWIKAIHQYIPLLEQPQLMQTAAEWFHSKWRVPTEAYLACMSDYLQGKTELGWYLCLDGEKIIGGLGVIENDFHDRPDLTPNICAVYTEEAYRRQGIAGRLLHMAVEDLREKGISPVYLLTDHTGFYERYGWEFLCMAQGDGEDKPSRMYIHK